MTTGLTHLSYVTAPGSLLLQRGSHEGDGHYGAALRVEQEAEVKSIIVRSLVLIVNLSGEQIAV